MRNSTHLLRLRVAVFAALLLAPVFGFATGIGRPSGERENRNLAELPPWPASVAAITDFTAGMDAYWDDHFGFRDQLTWAYSNLLYHGLGTVPFGKVRVTYSGWVFENIDDAQDCEARLPPVREFHVLATRMVELSRLLERRGVEYVVMLVPNRSYVHRPDAPTLACPLEDTAGYRLTQVIRRMGGRFPVVDPFPELVAGRQAEDFYYRTDAHWTDLGAFVGYLKLMTEVRRIYPAITALAPQDFNRETRRIGGGAISRLANLDIDEPPAVFLERRRPALAKRTTPLPKEGLDDPRGYERGVLRFELPDSALPSALVFRDSYFKPFKAWLPEHFARTTFIWSRPGMDVITSEAPDLVIEQHSF